MFDKCVFIECDFAYSSWKDVHFRKCTFEDCSFSLSTFFRCEFRDNDFIRIGFSGSKTDFDKSFVTNPEALIQAGVSATHPENKSLRHRMYQWFRLHGTKAHLSRTLLSSHNLVGDDKTFYQTAKLHDLQQSKSKISRSIFNIIFSETQGRPSSIASLVSDIVEYTLLRLIGFLNSWGASSIRPLIFLLLSFLAFGFVYSYAFEVVGFWQKSLNISMLVGYSNEFSYGLSERLRVVQNIQALFSILIYTVFFGTTIAKLSRVR